MIKNILITGAEGQLGSEIQALVMNQKALRLLAGGQYHFTDQSTLDITDAEAVSRYMQQYKIDYCINCAAYTAVDKAEEQEELAQLVNVEGPRNLAKAAAAVGAKLVHISTDYVYAGTASGPIRETAATDPQGVYGRTKLAGEQAVLAEQPDALIIRTAWVYSSIGHNFVKTMLRLGQERPSLSVVADQIGSPTFAGDLAEAILRILGQEESPSGLYHYSNEGVASWYDFAHAIFDLAKIDCALQPIDTKDYPTPAKRPAFSLLHKGKIKNDFGLQIPHWRESLARMLKTLRY
ncbi:dTDP-4-dehydrorhamnose reductase [Saprospira sp. CCB-QB6]|uniref:dTDP-4-dehydrorhamnose reductase n=1 Tax=Saprospira sp. CCB-QB6 TaxID=3023936 RepID=UPI00234AD6B4|nr:dTDP-4-dehydrorhamnose reductase [Saprospira sp. CCB-QB6]WCL82114.1 dTDP-4-dehydrorhamnose reductase [Saprospira sp. CCB-QB6]